VNRVDRDLPLILCVDMRYVMLVRVVEKHPD
jgi:hypothetical protein